MSNYKKSTIPVSPLDEIAGLEARSRESNEHRISEHGKQPNKESQTKERFTVHITNETKERVKNAVFWTPGLTLSDIAEIALLRELERLENEHGPFPQRTSDLKGGRPIR
jgi:hypothetical protein